jgi:hypothetical protein
MNRRTISLLVATGACLSLGSLAGLAAQATGDLWQITPQMAMQGITLPMPPQQICSAKQWTRPPAGSGPDPTCMASDFMMSGNKATWKIACQSPPSTGVGEITRMGADSWTGSIKFTSAQGEMTINLAASRSGECNSPS